MRNSSGVSGGERTRHLRRNIECGVTRHLAIFDTLPQCLAFDVLAHDKMIVIYVTNFMNRENVRIVESRGRLRFLLKATNAIWVCSKSGGQQLERNLASKLGVFGQVDFTHPSCAD